MNGIIIYYSRYGSTKQYADWLSEETGFQTHSTKEQNIPLSEYETVILGSPTLAKKPFLAKWIIKHWAQLDGKEIVLFTTSGATPPDDALQKGYNEAVPQEMRAGISYFPLPGRMIYSKLAPLHKMMMKIGQMIEKDPVAKVEMLKDVDGVSRDNIQEIAAYIRNLGSEKVT